MVRHRIPAEYQGEEIVIHNTLSFYVQMEFEPGMTRQYDPVSVASAEEQKVEYVTERIAKQVFDDSMIEVEDLGIEVLDPESEEVNQL